MTDSVADTAVADALRARIAALEATIAARDLTIDALAERVEQRQASTSTFALFEQNLSLERVVARKTHELQQQSASLAEALNELQHAHASLLHAQKMESIGNLAAGIAHEINTPMQFILDNTTFVRESLQTLLPLLVALRAAATPDAPLARALVDADVDYLIEEMPRALAETREGIDRVRSIVTAMRNFAHRDDVEFSLVDVNENITTTMIVARSEWRYVAEVRCEFDPKLPPVPALRDELNQVVLNLLVNAAHAIHDRPKAPGLAAGVVVLRPRRERDDVVIEVVDNGGGIPAAIRDRVYDPFFTTKPVGKGTGQGLAIARSVVDKHHGSIDFGDNDIGGTTFVIRLPLHQVGSPPAPSFDPRQVPA
ncbi:MAG TPA: ATP-binding protein [Myxococcota bacterium]